MAGNVQDITSKPHRSGRECRDHHHASVIDQYIKFAACLEEIGGSSGHTVEAGQVALQRMEIRCPVLLIARRDIKP